MFPRQLTSLLTKNMVSSRSLLPSSYHLPSFPYIRSMSLSTKEKLDAIRNGTMTPTTHQEHGMSRVKVDSFLRGQKDIGDVRKLSQTGTQFPTKMLILGCMVIVVSQVGTTLWDFHVEMYGGLPYQNDGITK